MLKLRSIFQLLVLGMSIGAVAQDNPPSQPAPTPAPAFGQNAPILNPDNPPLSGLDEPSLDLKTASRSFISPALEVAESGDSNAQNQLAGSGPEAVTTVMGAFDLQKFWPRSDLFLEYLGGAGFGDSPYYVRQLESMGFEGVTRWRTGQLTLRDIFSYLPDGSFYAETAGGLPGFGFASAGLGLGLPGVFRLTTENGIGSIPRLANTGIAEVTQAISPRSAFTVVGAYANTHFYHNIDNLVNGDETTVEAGYSHLVSRHDQFAVVYAFQVFRFPFNSGGEIYNDIVNLRYSHTVSQRLSLLGEVGPQYTDLHYGVHNTQWSPSGRGVVRYRFERVSLMASYEKFVSQGSGFFAGSDTQIVQGLLLRPLGRTYQFQAEGGFSHNKRLQPEPAGCGSNCAGVPAQSYNEEFLGVTLRKHVGRLFDAFAAYRFSEVSFPTDVSLGGGTGKTDLRQIGTIGLEWHPRPTRIE